MIPEELMQPHLSETHDAAFPILRSLVSDFLNLTGEGPYIPHDDSRYSLFILSFLS